MNTSPHDKRADLEADQEPCTGGEGASTSEWTPATLVSQAIHELGGAWVAQKAGCDGPLSADQEERVLGELFDQIIASPRDNSE